MKPDEVLAAAYLRGLDLGPVVYEPDGGVPPDFVIDGRIAVEVRRLNQNYEGREGMEGLETVEASILQFFEKLLPILGSPLDRRSWFVFYTFRRPLDWRSLRTSIRAALEGFDPARHGDTPRFKLAPGFELDLAPATHSHDSRFVMGGYDDRQAGGFVGSEILRNARLCIAEKAAKVRPYLDRYPEWWLLMIDRIGPKLNRDERERLTSQLLLGDWRRVILIDPAPPHAALDL